MSELATVGLSIPKDILKKIDADRGDIPRSRYFLRLAEKALDAKKPENRQGPTAN